MLATGPVTDRTRRLMAKERARELLSEVVAREGQVIRHCLGLIDTGLRRLRRNSGGPLTEAAGAHFLARNDGTMVREIVLNEVTWRTVESLFRCGFERVLVDRLVENLTLRGAAKGISSRFWIHDKVRQVRAPRQADVPVIK